MDGATVITTTSTVGGMEGTAAPLPLRTGSFVLCQASVNQSASVKTLTQKKMKLQTRLTTKKLAGSMSKMTKMTKTMTISQREVCQTRNGTIGLRHDDVTTFLTFF